MYDQFIITRYDHYYAFEHTPLYVNNLPHGEDYGGITDRHMFINTDNVLASLDIIVFEKELYALRFDSRFDHTRSLRLIRIGYTYQRI
jgi:hypothetical protein